VSVDRLDRGDFVILGGGVLGLALAYNLARLGAKDVVVVERSHLNAGASARCGGGVRQQWSTPENIEWMKESVRLFARMPRDLGANIWFLQTGYLFLATTPEHVAQFEKNVRLQNEHGVPTRLLSPAEVGKLVPALDVSGFLAGAFNPTDGHLFPFPVVWGYADAARKLGARIHTFTEVVGLDAAGDRVTEVVTTRGRIAAGTVVNACGAWSAPVGRMLGVDLPNVPEKHEILVTEPLAPFVDPAVIPMDSGLYCSQTVRGELCACVGMPGDRGADTGSTFAFAQYISGILTRLFPRLADVKLLRQWAGFYDVTPDTQPILGPLEVLPNFVQFHGFMGHGFMMAPFMARTMAEFLLRGNHRDLLAPYRFERFRDGGLARESMIIG
jgi:sarcosine oxidase subunit beta